MTYKPLANFDKNPLKITQYNQDTDSNHDKEHDKEGLTIKPKSALSSGSSNEYKASAWYQQYGSPTYNFREVNNWIEQPLTKVEPISIP